MYYNLVIGVVGGVLASMICVGTVAIWRQMFFPKLLEAFYETVHLHEKWRASLDFGRGARHEIVVTLHKHGKWLSGQIDFVSGRHQGKTYPLSGYFKGGILTFTYEASDRKSTSQGSGTFERLLDGEVLSGGLAYYSPEQKKVDFIRCELVPVHARNNEVQRSVSSVASVASPLPLPSAEAAAPGERPSQERPQHIAEGVQGVS